MTKNIGTNDKGLRYCLAIVCAASAYTRQTQDVWFWLLCVVGGIIFFSAITGYSLLYDLIGENTLDTPRGKNQDTKEE